MSIVLQPLKCLACGAPLKSKERDLMLICEHCGNLSLFADGKTSPVEFAIVKPTVEEKDPLWYVPFWVVNADVIVHREKISGGGISRAVTGQKQMCGTRDFYICAADAVPEEYARVWNMELTINQPEFTTIPEFKNGSRMVMTMEKDTAGNNAEFIFLRYEAEIPGTLQELDYDFIVKSAKVLYLPAYKKPTSYMLGVLNGK